VFFMTTRSAWGLGLATVTDDGNTLDVWYPRPVLGDEPEDGHADLLGTLSAMERRDEARGVHTTVVRTWADLDDAPQTVAGAYLRLHVLSHRLATPNTVNLDGEQHHLRLYFSEPDDEDRLLLSLSFRHKRGGKRGLEEQDEHIAEAQRRFESWAQTP